MSSPDTSSSYRAFSLGRVSAIARITLTQLIRMRAFYFLLVFSLLALGAALMIENFEIDPSRELKVIKDMSFFSMSLFSILFAVVATANLIPKDVEDRTLYTILAKPVPRFEYLLGKYIGTLVVIAISMVFMTALLYALLYLRQRALMAEELISLGTTGSQNQVDSATLMVRKIRDAGVSWNLLNGPATISLQACVLGAMTLMVSTVATSGLFTVVVTFVLFFVGYIYPDVIDYWRTTGPVGPIKESVITIFKTIFPNFRTFNVVDDIVTGQTLPLRTLLMMGVNAATYVAGYLLVAYLFFAKKEL